MLVGGECEDWRVGGDSGTGFVLVGGECEDWRVGSARDNVRSSDNFRVIMPRDRSIS